MSNIPRRLLSDTLLAAAAKYPHKIAIIVEGKAYSYAELRGAALRLATAFQDRGLLRGDRVAIYMENTWPCVVSVYATLLAGGAFVVINPQTKANKLAYLLSDSEARILVTDAQLARSFVPALEAVDDIRCVICSGQLPASYPEVLAFDQVIAEHVPALRDVGTIPIDLAALIYTSGTTGNAKGVMLTHLNMLFAAGSITQYLRLSSEDRILNVLPLAFDYGLYQLIMTVYLGATLVLEQSFAYPVQILRRAAEERVTVFPGVPTIYATLLSLRKKSSDVVLPAVTRVTNTAAALPADFVPQLREIFPRALIFAMYGLTECKRVSYLEPERLGDKPTSVGRAIPGTEVFLLSPDGEPVPPGETGILHVRGPHVMLGYWKAPELTAHMLKEGRYPGERVLCTHDYFKLDEEGFLYFVGRSDDIIKTRGEKVSPIEVENVLYGIRGVREAAVIGIPDVMLGEAVCAFVVQEEGAGLTEQDIKKACVLQLENFMVPKEIVFLTALPKSSNGKIRKLALREPLASRDDQHGRQTQVESMAQVS